jgi:biotin carboxyl carrier protein
MDSLRQELLDLVNEIQIATLFDKLKKLKIVDSAASNLRAEFVHGNYKHDFYQRVQMLIDDKFDELEKKEQDSFSKAESIEALQKHIEEYQVYQGQTIPKAKEKLANLLYLQRLQSSWENAQEKDQIATYQDFIAEFPKEKQKIDIAQQRIIQLEEEASWKDKTDKISRLIALYLQEYPEGKYGKLAKDITQIIATSIPLLPAGYLLKMPKMSDTMTEGVIANWLVKVGDKVTAGDIVVEVETDKATMELESLVNGILVYIVEKGTVVPLGDIVAIILDNSISFSAVSQDYLTKASP